MKFLFINSVCGIGSTGRICTDLSEILEERGHICKIVYGRGELLPKHKKYALKIGGKANVLLHTLSARIFDNAGFGSIVATKKIIKIIEEYDPDIIHLHNLHGYYINVKILFDYLKKSNKMVFWSFYDCWSFTGHCAHFDYNGCDGWKSGCINCRYKKQYPQSLLFSKSRKNYEKKRNLFTDVNRLQIFAPSRWMEGLVKESFFNKYPINLLPNGIDLRVFKHNNNITKEKLNSGGKFVILGVSSIWHKNKGVDEFIFLNSVLDKDKFQIIMVGALSKSISMPSGIIHIPKTNDITELCSYYSVADVFVNPTYQETQGLTTVEAMACGTPVIVYNSGGAAECVNDQCGVVVERGDKEGLKNAVIKIAENDICFDSERISGQAKKYDKFKLYEDFIKLYEGK